MIKFILYEKNKFLNATVYIYYFEYSAYIVEVEI